MPIVCLSWETAHLYGEAWVSHHRLRYRAFVERQAWNIPSHNGLEYDQFDTPAAKYILWLDKNGQARGATRLIPTTRPYMLQTVWPHLMIRRPPESDDIWEASRFACDHDLDPQTHRMVVLDLICACQRFGLENGIGSYLSVMPLGVYRNVLEAAGCHVMLLGPSQKMGRHRIAAASIAVSRSILAAIRAQAALRHRPGEQSGYDRLAA